jgi:hypothetical protein
VIFHLEEDPPKIRLVADEIQDSWWSLEKDISLTAREAFKKV